MFSNNNTPWGRLKVDAAEPPCKTAVFPTLGPNLRSFSAAITNSGNIYFAGGSNKQFGNPLGASALLGAGYVVTAGGSPDRILSGSSYAVGLPVPGLAFIHSPGNGVAQVLEQHSDPLSQKGLLNHLQTLAKRRQHENRRSRFLG